MINRTSYNRKAVYAPQQKLTLLFWVCVEKLSGAHQAYFQYKHLKKIEKLFFK
jgi:hypothetical protein